jgi:microsomal dipeptidase-like Zn-dependent dipeptidase
LSPSSHEWLSWTARFGFIPPAPLCGRTTQPRKCPDMPSGKHWVGHMKRQVDTALNGAKHSVASVVEFLGVEHVLFGTDTPFDPEQGRGFIRDTIADISALDVDDSARKQIYEDNAIRVLGIKS